MIGNSSGDDYEATGILAGKEKEVEVEHPAIKLRDKVDNNDSATAVEARTTSPRSAGKILTSLTIAPVTTGRDRQVEKEEERKAMEKTTKEEGRKVTVENMEEKEQEKVVGVQP